MKIKHFCTLGFLMAAIAIQAGPPTVLSVQGVLRGVVFDTGGLQLQDVQKGQTTGRRQHKPFTFNFSPETNSTILQGIATDFGPPAAGIVSTDTEWSIHRAEHQVGPSITVLSPGFSSLTIPGMDATAKDPAFMGASLDCDDFSINGFSRTSEAERDLIQAQKKWLPSNFKFEIDGISASGVTSVAPLTLSLGDVNADGSRSLQASDAAIGVGILGSPEYFAWLNNVIKGVDDIRSCRYTIFMTDGTPCCTIQMQVRVTSVGPVDLLGFLTGTSPTISVSMKTGTVKFFNNAKGFG